MKIPMVDLQGQYQDLKEEIDPAILQALGETRFILGPNVQAFEEEATAYLGVNHAIRAHNTTSKTEMPAIFTSPAGILFMRAV